jgi:hypothetical protein
MCKFASFVLTKDREFWSETTDSHTDIISEHNLHEMGASGVNIVRVESSPTDKIKKWPSLKAWAYKVAQDPRYNGNTHSRRVAAPFQGRL